ncbi:hypothetical protein SNEBB_004404 [Seison nebaliae]|nr:hypothetical protein SNEBB_004404 [Seison nebaliae]
MLHLNIFTFIASCMMTFGGIIPFIPQFLLMRNHHKTGDDKNGFSLYVCLVLIIASILRVNFWFGHRFELPLLMQSFVLISGMFVLVHTHCRFVINENEQKKYFLDMEVNNFWKWTDFTSYIQCFFLLIFIITSTTYVMIGFWIYVELVGFLAVFLEALLGLPQFVQNFTRKSTAGMSLTMVMMWMAGDLFKTAYFILRKSPTQFMICSSLQISVDVAIMIQVVLYSSRFKQRHKHKPSDGMTMDNYTIRTDKQTFREVTLGDVNIIEDANKDLVMHRTRILDKEIDTGSGSTTDSNGSVNNFTLNVPQHPLKAKTSTINSVNPA